MRPVRVRVVFAAPEPNPEVWLRPSPGTRKESQVLRAVDGDGAVRAHASQHNRSAVSIHILSQPQMERGIMNRH